MQTRLKEIRRELGYTQRRMAQYLEVSLATYQNWEYGHREMTLGRAVQIAEKFGVSLDYLCGLTTRRNAVVEEMRTLPQRSIENVYEFIAFEKAKALNDQRAARNAAQQKGKHKN